MLDYISDSAMLPDEYHNTMTVYFGDLLDTKGGIDWTTPPWDWSAIAYDQEQYQRCCNKIELAYYDREIGVLPPSRWRRHFLKLIYEIMPVLKPLYKLYAKDDTIFLADSDTYAKYRTMFSDFPASQLNHNQDYASNATDHQSETVTTGNIMDMLEKIRNGEYVDLDIILVQHLEPCFSPLYTVNVNNY